MRAGSNTELCQAKDWRLTWICDVKVYSHFLPGCSCLSRPTSELFFKKPLWYNFSWKKCFYVEYHRVEKHARNSDIKTNYQLAVGDKISCLEFFLLSDGNNTLSWLVTVVLTSYSSKMYSLSRPEGTCSITYLTDVEQF